jgi:MFS family permease
MTPLHMDHGGASLQVVGLVLSVHILGMFAFSPLVGRATDRFGRRAVIAVGGLMLLAAVALAGTAQEGHSAGLTAGLFLLGLGWSLVLVAGSTLVGAGLGPHERPRVQGAADVMMGVSAAAAGALSGVVVGAWGYGTLNAAAGALALVVLAVALTPVRASG